MWEEDARSRRTPSEPGRRGTQPRPGGGRFDAAGPEGPAIEIRSAPVGRTRRCADDLASTTRFRGASARTDGCAIPGVATERMPPMKTALTAAAGGRAPRLPLATPTESTTAAASMVARALTAGVSREWASVAFMADRSRRAMGRKVSVSAIRVMNQDDPRNARTPVHRESAPHPVSRHENTNLVPGTP